MSMDEIAELFNFSDRGQRNYSRQRLITARKWLDLRSANGLHRLIGVNDYYHLLIESSCSLDNAEMKVIHKKLTQEFELLDGWDCDSIEGIGRYCELPKRSGIYFCIRQIYGIPDEVWYVGKTNDFRARWRSHQKFKALKAIGNVYVHCLPMDDCSDDEISIFERAYIEMLCPVFNNTSLPEKHLGRDV